MNVLILGCGTIGALVGGMLVAGGNQVLGVRRQPSVSEAGFRIVAGDIADPAWWNRFTLITIDVMDALGKPGATTFDAVLLAANPGLRRGRDNGLDRALPLLTRHLPRVRLVYTGSTAVYADAGGAGVDEHGRVDAADPALAGLLAIERAVLAHAGSLVLRMPALVGPSRLHSLERLRAGEGTVRGDLARPFSFLHELDCAELCVEALSIAGEGPGAGLGTGILNAASPERITAADYYAALARAAHVLPPRGDGAAGPSRWIDASRLWRMRPARAWRGYEPE